MAVLRAQLAIGLRNRKAGGTSRRICDSDTQSAEQPHHAYQVELPDSERVVASGHQHVAAAVEEGDAEGCL